MASVITLTDVKTILCSYTRKPPNETPVFSSVFYLVCNNELSRCVVALKESRVVAEGSFFLASFPFLVRLHKNASEYRSKWRGKGRLPCASHFFQRGFKKEKRRIFFHCCDSLGALSHESIYGALFRHGLEEWYWRILETDS